MSSPPVAFPNPASANGENALTESIRAKYPGAYDDMNGAQLTRAILDKFPQYHDLAVSPPSGAQPEQSLVGKAMNTAHSSIAAGNQELNKSTDDQGNLLPFSTRFAHGVGRLAMIPANMADMAVIKPFADPKATEQIFGPQPSGMLDPVSGYQNYLAHQFILDPAKQQFQKAGEDYRQGHYSEMAGHGMAGVLPVVGPAAAGVGERLGTGDVAGASLDALPLASMSPTFRGIAGKGLNAITPNEPIVNFDFSKVPRDIGSALRSTPAKAIGTAGAAADAFFTGHPGVGTGIAAFGYPRISSLFNKAANFVDPNPLMRPLMPNIRPGATADVMADSFARNSEPTPSVGPSARQPLWRQAGVTAGRPDPLVTADPTQPVSSRTVFPQPQEPASAPSRGITQEVEGQRSPNADIRNLGGESALRQVLTGQDNANLMRIAKSRGINVGQESQLKPGIADKMLVEKIISDYSPEELDEVGARYAESARFRHNFGDIGPEPWKTMGMQTYFPDVKIPQAVMKRTQSAIAASNPLDVPGVSPLDRPLVNAPRGITQPVPESVAPVVGPDPSFRPGILKQGNPVAQSQPRVLGKSGQYLMDEPIINERPEVPAVGESLEDRLMRSIQQAEAKKRRAGVGR